MPNKNDYAAKKSIARSAQPAMRRYKRPVRDRAQRRHYLAEERRNCMNFLGLHSPAISRAAFIGMP